MTSIKIKYHPSEKEDNSGIICYQIIHERKTRKLYTDYKIYRSEWDEKRSVVMAGPSKNRKTYIMAINDHIRRDIKRINAIILKLDHPGIEYTADDIIKEFLRYIEESSLFNYMEGVITKLKYAGKVRTSETYTVTLNSFKKFRRGKDIMLDSLNNEIIEEYELWHRRRGTVPNTISFYLRILRAVYNRAVEDGIIEHQNPFRHVFTGVDKTIKRALPLSVIKKIKNMDLSISPALDYARDMFIISFMLRGMSFIDMAYLRKSDLKNGYVIYRRRKTGQQLIIKWTKEMQMVLDKYPENTTDYLLPIIRKQGINERYAYRNVNYNINHNLKTIAKKIGIKVPLTLYVARHSWASIAKSKGIPIRIISEGLGHDSETTTQIYLASLDTNVVDKANAMILKNL